MVGVAAEQASVEGAVEAEQTVSARPARQQPEQEGPDLPDSVIAPDDLALLLYRAAQSMRLRMDRIARHCGLGDSRDWVVLAVLADSEQPTQLALGRVVGVDKTTLTAVLDRLERNGLVRRRPDPHDRRVRIPEVTDAGRGVVRRVEVARADREAEAVDGLSAAEQDLLREVLLRLVTTPAALG